MTEMEQLDKLSEANGGIHQQRLINILSKQIEQKVLDINQKKQETLKIESDLEEFKNKLKTVRFRLETTNRLLFSDSFCEVLQNSFYQAQN